MYRKKARGPARCLRRHYCRAQPLDLLRKLLHHIPMRVPLIAAFLCLLLPIAALADPTEPELMAQGQRAFIAGDYDTATQTFAEVLQLDPHNNLAIQYLRAIRSKQASIAPVENDPVKSLVLPIVNLKEATFSSSLDFLKQSAAKRSVNVSFVSQLPAAQMDTRITLNITNIPFLEALRYLCALNNATYKIDPYAIVIMPAAAASPAPDASSQSPDTSTAIPGISPQ